MFFLFLGFFVSHAQNQNHWVCINSGNYYNAGDSADYAFDMDFNTEPPKVKVIRNKKGINNWATNLTYSDNKGLLNLYNSEDFGFFNSKHQQLNDTMWFTSTGDNVAYMFPTTNDSIKLIIYREDSLVQFTDPTTKEGGEVFLQWGLYNTRQQKFMLFNQLVDLKSGYFNPFRWHRADYNTHFSYHIFKQFIDEKSGNYYLFFNIADTVFTSRYNPADMSFSKPYYSGMVCDRNKARNWVPADVGQGEDFIINHAASKAIYINSGKRDNYLELLSHNSKALMSFDFDKNTGMFTNEKLMEVLDSQTTQFRKCIALNDSILYLSYVNNIKSHIIYKYLLGNDYNIKSKHSIPIPSTQLTFISDMAIAPNGKIYFSKYIHRNLSIDSIVSIIENPNEYNGTIKLSKLNIYKDNKLGSEYVIIFNFPNTYGSYRRVDFSTRGNCKKSSVVFTNHSDTFWFKSFRYYMGNGDSVDVGYKNPQLVYYYSQPGKYHVKLRAYNGKGGWVWFSDTIVVKTAPSAYFTNQTTQGCQYVAFQFKDSGRVYQVKQDSMARHHWQFGDGSNLVWLTKNINEHRNQNHVYNKDGIYTVVHTVSDGYCTDTFTRLNEVKIQPAPKPGIVALPVSGCLALNVTLGNKYTDAVDSTLWNSTAGHRQTVLNRQNINFMFTQAGNFKVLQALYGSTGCITRDTVNITVLQGVDRGYSPQVIAATVNQESVVVNWIKTANANSYDIYRDNLLLGSVNDTFFADRQADFNNASYTYHIVARDVCHESTLKSNTGKTILLNANKDNNNIAVLRWNPYTTWANGVQAYNIMHIADFSTTINTTTDSSATDPYFLINAQTEKCYRITAIEKGGNHAQSESNTVCVPYESVIWIPSAITINGDGLNESLKISTIGIKSFTISIYTRWGQKIHEFSSIGDEWKPTPEQQGVYMFVIKAVSKYGNYETTGTITVLR